MGDSVVWFSVLIMHSGTQTYEPSLGVCASLSHFFLWKKTEEMREGDVRGEKTGWDLSTALGLVDDLQCKFFSRRSETTPLELKLKLALTLQLCAQYRLSAHKGAAVTVSRRTTTVLLETYVNCRSQDYTATRNTARIWDHMLGEKLNTRMTYKALLPPWIRSFKFV